MKDFFRKNLFKCIALVIILIMLAALQLGRGQDPQTTDTPVETVSPTPLPSAEFQAAPQAVEASA